MLTRQRFKATTVIESTTSLQEFLPPHAHWCHFVSVLAHLITFSTQPKIHEFQKNVNEKYEAKKCGAFNMNPFYPNISMHILHTVLHTFPKILTRRIYLTIKSFFGRRSFSLFS